MTYKSGSTISASLKGGSKILGERKLFHVFTNIQEYGSTPQDKICKKVNMTPIPKILQNTARTWLVQSRDLHFWLV